MDFPNDGNGDVLKQMYEAGTDMTQPQNIDFYFMFENKKDADAMLAVVHKQADVVQAKMIDSGIEGVWELCCTINMVPAYDEMVATEAAFEKIVRAYNGYGDGWGAQG